MNFGKIAIDNKQYELNATSQKLTNKFLVLVVKIIIAVVIALGVFGLCAGLGIYRSVLSQTPQVKLADIVASGQATIVYDDAGNEIDTYVSSNSNRIQISSEEIPQCLKDAFVAIEDERFYQHNGIDYKGMFRAGYEFIVSGGNETQGASTITQQLLKNTVFTTWTSEGHNMIKKIKRKLQEQYLAIEVSKRFTKDEVLTRYLNAINLGQNTLGVESASQRYFGKSAIDLSISEAAVIACITQNPSKYNPISHPEYNVERREKCLTKMRDLGFITQTEYDMAMDDTEDVYERIGYHNTSLKTGYSTQASYFSDTVYKQVKQDLIAAGYSKEAAESMMVSGGLRIYSTMNSEFQKIVDEEVENPDNYPNNPQWLLRYALTIFDKKGKPHHYSQEMMTLYYKENGKKNFSLLFREKDDALEAAAVYKNAMLNELGIEDLEENYQENLSITPQPQIALVIEDQTTGYVLAMSGGCGDKIGRLTFNRATDSTRSPGSTFKILASFLPGIDACGMTLATVYNDAPFNYENGTPVNNWYTTGYRGINSIRDGIRDSMNIIAVKNVTVVTPELAYNYLKNFGFTTITDHKEVGNLIYTDVTQSIALGGLTNGVTPYELNAAYAAIANGGVYIQPKVYSKVTNSAGEVILDNTHPASRRVVRETSAWLITNAMEDVVNRGTGTRCRLSTTDVSGKTGTSSDSKDVCFAGFTGYYTCTTWAGYDNNQSLYTSGRADEQPIAANLWKAVMSRIHADLPRIDFDDWKPKDIIKVEVCSQSGMLPVPGLCDGHIKSEYFEEGTEPTEHCTVHYAGAVCALDGLAACETCPFATYGVITMPLVEDEALIQGSSVIVENPDGTVTQFLPSTSNFCHHNEEFFANPEAWVLLEQEQAAAQARINEMLAASGYTENDEDEE